MMTNHVCMHKHIIQITGKAPDMCENSCRVTQSTTGVTLRMARLNYYNLNGIIKIYKVTKERMLWDLIL